jgi:hypothetical protein
VLAAPPLERQLACPSQISSATWYQFNESFYYITARIMLTKRVEKTLVLQ